MARTSSRGFTLIEMLAAILIVGLILAILLPAILSAREAARRIECASHLRTIGLALHQHQEARGRFPAGMESWRPSAMWELASFLYTILPLIEQQPLFDTVNVACATVGEENRTAHRLIPATFLCPSDSARAEAMAPAAANYAGNAGAGEGFPGRWDGVFVNNSRGLTPAELPDGLGMTVGLAEWIVGPGTMRRPSRLGTVFRIPGPTGRDAFLAACIALEPAGGPDEVEAVPVGYKGGWWLDADLGFSRYTHALPPNRPSCVGRASVRAYTAGSFHPGGCHVMMMDGSARFVQNSVARSIWRALGTRAGGEAVSSNAY